MNKENLLKMTQTAEILINLAEEIIDNATELQYLFIERMGVLEDFQSSTSEKVPEMRSLGSDKERTQEIKGEMDSSLQVQKMYVPIFRLSQKNDSST